MLIYFHGNSAFSLPNFMTLGDDYQRIYQLAYLYRPASALQ